MHAKMIINRPNSILSTFLSFLHLFYCRLRKSEIRCCSLSPPPIFLSPASIPRYIIYIIFTIYITNYLILIYLFVYLVMHAYICIIIYACMIKYFPYAFHNLCDTPCCSLLCYVIKF